MILQAHNLKKSFGSIDVLKNISLELKKGESLSLMGESGRGKTTLLYLLAGLDSVDHGSIVVNNSRIDNLSESQLALFRKKNFGFIFQHHFLLNDLNALENTLLPLRISNCISQDKIKYAKDLFHKLGISERMTHYPDTLSGGEAQRVAIIRALINDPLIVFADEPTGSLDKKNADILEEIFFGILKEKNISLIISTHSKELAQKCSTCKTIDELEG